MTILGPFSFDRALKGAEVVLSDGSPVRILCWDACDLFPIVAIVGTGNVKQYTKDGKESFGDRSFDLFIRYRNELNEFEKKIRTIINEYAASGEQLTEEEMKDLGPGLLKMAEEEILKTGIGGCIMGILRSKGR